MMFRDDFSRETVEVLVREVYRRVHGSREKPWVRRRRVFQHTRGAVLRLAHVSRDARVERLDGKFHAAARQGPKERVCVRQRALRFRAGG